MNVYNLLIVEDEKSTLDYVIKYLTEELSLYFHIYSADSGKSALEIMEKIKIDIVITDIMMPIMDGIELAEEIYKNYKDCIVIIMSGYDEFEYAQKAMRYAVREYFLKPIEFEELCERIMLFKDELDNRKTRETEEFRFAEELAEEREHFFISLLYSGNTNAQAELEKARALSLNFDLDNTPCDVILLKLEDYSDFIAKKWRYEQDMFKLALNNLVKKILENQNVFCTRSENGYFEYIIYHNEEKLDYDDLTSKISTIANISACLNEPVKSYANLSELLEDRKINTNVEEKTLLFVTCLKEKNYDEAKKILASAFNNKIIREKLKKIILEHEFSSEIKSIFEQDNPYEKYFEIFQNEDTASNGNNSIYTSIENAIKYINKNYKKNISREEVSKAVYLSPAHFTRCFKAYTGENFSDYLLQVRMENAIRLMKEKKYNVEKIAEMVGYNSSNYFYRVFKLYSGFSPKEYMIHVLGQSCNND